MSKKVLIIEDDEAIVDVMTFILEDAGYEVISSSGSSALKDVHETKPAVILMDNRLTDGYGEDFCRSFKQNPATSHFRVVLISANSDIEQLAQGSFADAFLKKPFEITQLVELVNRLTH
jgi:CheY-like chemotaxis protein